MRELTGTILGSSGPKPSGPRRLCAVLGLSLVAACGPMSLESAERECFERARLAQQPRGTVTLGGSNRGAVAGLDITISSDYLAGRDPSQVYDSCVMAKAGQPPSRPLYAMPGWKG